MLNEIYISNKTTSECKSAIYADDLRCLAIAEINSSCLSLKIRQAQKAKVR